ncbi:MAG: IPT/TIG domain-containing protein [Acidobacteriota bacterium]|nr:IPT/TIG domain-containing protein [Acidobacteriota bacterium]
MASTPAQSPYSGRSALASPVTPSARPLPRAILRRAKSTLLLLAGTLALTSFALLAPLAVRAQSDTPHISSVTPTEGKCLDSITISGENLGKDKVAAVFLSDEKLDHKAVVVDQEKTKIVIKVPNDLKPGDYNISVQEGGAIYIQPVIFVVKT